MKILNNTDFDRINGKAGNYDSIVKALTDKNPGLNSDEVTVESIIELMQSSDNDNESERIEKLTLELNTANNRITELETENGNLKGSAAEETAELKSKTETGGEKETIAAFADKNSGDTAAILAKMQEEGLI